MSTPNKVEQAIQKQTIADHGREASRHKKTSTHDAVLAAIREIERVIEQNHGIYPFTKDGKVSVQEILRRAGKSAAALEKSQHKAKGGLKDIVTDSVGRINGRTPGSVRIVRKMITERINEADERLKTFRQAWAEAELEYIQTKEDLLQKVQEIVALKREIEILKAEIAQSNIIKLHTS